MSTISLKVSFRNADVTIVSCRECLLRRKNKKIQSNQILVEASQKIRNKADFRFQISGVNCSWSIVKRSQCCAAYEAMARDDILSVYLL